jgi:hypothetical protein
MFDLSLAPANPKEVKRWRTLSGVTAGGTSLLSIGALASSLTGMLPEDLVAENFVYMSLAIAFVAALPIAVFPRVISVSLSQLGIATSLIYLGCSVAGVFRPDYVNTLEVILLLLALVFVVLFSSGLGFSIKQSSWSDLLLGIFLLVVSVYLWVSPVLKLGGQLWTK